jgi:PA14 domain
MQYFAKAGDSDLKAAAAMELENPSDAKAHLAVADAWDQLSAKRRGPEKQPFELRAFHWYLKSSASAQGLDKAKADKRVEEMRGAIEKRLLADAGKAGAAPSELKALLSPGLVVEYFADQQLGSRALMKVVENVRTNPLHRNETKMALQGQFSARWTGWLIPPKAGTYKIVFNYRAGVYIDGKPVVAPRQTKTDVVVELSPRPHHIRYEAANLGWGSMPRFEWQSEEETAPRPITPEFLFHVPLPGEAPAELPVVRTRL